MISADSQDDNKRKSGRVPITLPTTTTTTTTTTTSTTTTTTSTTTTSSTPRIVTTHNVYRSTIYSAQDRYGFSGVIDNSERIKVNSPVLSDNIIDNTGDLLGHNDHIKPKTGARIRDDAHNFHQGLLLLPYY